LSEIRIAYEESDGFHILCVNDNGVGVKNENAEKIFDPFERSVLFQQIEGAGLGLAIVKEIAAQHQGEVWVANGEEKGTTFCVSISKNLELERGTGINK
jgi:signal transduction histidine kinase